MPEPLSLRVCVLCPDCMVQYKLSYARTVDLPSGEAFAVTCVRCHATAMAQQESDRA